jgi:hypothetical protein
VALRPASPCESGLIENTDVCDTPEAREVIAVCEAYRKALEARDGKRLLALASKDYLEDGGTADESDDVRHEDLADYLSLQLGGVESIRYEIRYRQVRFADRVRVDFVYAASYRFRTEWKRRTDEGTLVLQREEDGVLRIVKGM